MNMNSSPPPEDATPDAVPRRPLRIEQIRRWVEYIEDHPAEVWGVQQNAIVNGQVASAQAVGLSAEHTAKVSDIAQSLLENTDG